MKRVLFSILCVTAGLLSSKAYACTNIIVGKEASVDGSVICAYNCDGNAYYGYLWFYPGGVHKPGEMAPVHEHNHYENFVCIPQVERTFNQIGYINENQVTIVETTSTGRRELLNPNGIFSYRVHMNIALQRSRTAREAIDIIARMTAEHGYNSTGETLTVCDKNEAWIMEIIGKGPDTKGAVWVAVRIPDDCICAHANVVRIRQFPQAGKVDRKLGYYVVDGECMYSADCISFARSKGFFTGEDKDFSFREAYCPIDFDKVRYCDARVWSIFRHHSDPAVMDSYLPYINGEFDKCDHLPLYIKPAAKLSLRDVMNDMRDHYEGTPLDMTADVSAGPYGMPIRPLSRKFKDGDGGSYFFERPVATQQTCYTMVCQMRSWLPDPVGGVMYYNCDDAACVAYVPIYCGCNIVPDAFSQKYADLTRFNPKGAYWLNNFVANMVYPRWSLVSPELKAAQKELEDYYEADQAEVLKAIEGMEIPDMNVYLTRKSISYTEKMMQRWGELAERIIIRYNDLLQMKLDENGNVNGNRKYTTPGFKESFNGEIVRGTGTRYLLK